MLIATRDGRSFHDPEVGFDANSEQRLAKRLGFIRNEGQFDEALRFQLRTRNGAVIVQDDRLVFTLHSPLDADALIEMPAVMPEPIRSTAFVMEFVGATPENCFGRDPGLTKINFIRGNDPTRWRENVSTFGSVMIDDLYPGIDLALSRGPQGLEYDFVVSPSAKPDAIAIRFRGDARTSLLDDGTLRVDTSLGPMFHLPPNSFELLANGERVSVASRFVPHGDREFGLEAERIDPSRTLVIDPQVTIPLWTPTFFSYVGDDENDIVLDIVQQADRVFVTGATDALSASLSGLRFTDVGSNPLAGAPAATNEFSTTTLLGGPLHQDLDIFVAKFNQEGDDLLWVTFLSGDSPTSGFGFEAGKGIDVDAQGNVVVCGFTGSVNFPVVGSPFPSTANGQGEGFVTKLNNTGGGPIFSVLLSGTFPDTCEDVKVDPFQNVYICGYTDSSAGVPVPFPSGSGTLEPTHTGFGFAAYCMKLAPSPPSIAFMTYLRTNGASVSVDTRAYGIDLYISETNPSEVSPAVVGEVFDPVGGGTYWTSSNSFQTGSINGDSSAFVTLLNPAAIAVTFSSIFNGNNTERAVDCVITSNGMVGVVGTTNSNSGLPLSNPIQSSLHGGNEDAFVLRINPNAPTGSQALEISTYLGGIGNDQGWSISADGAGGVYVTGTTESATGFTSTTGSNLITASAPFDQLHGTRDAFVFKIRGLNVTYGAYVGGSGVETAYCIDYSSHAWAIGGTMTTIDYHQVLLPYFPQLHTLDTGVPKSSKTVLDSTPLWSPTEPDLNTWITSTDGFVLRMTSNG